jgi:hypothetical protein
MVPLRSIIKAWLVFSVAFIIGYGVTGYAPHLGAFDASIALDSMIPFIPFFALFYLAGLVYPFLAFFVVPDEKRLTAALHGFLLTMGIAFVCFVIFPIELPKQVTYTESIFSWAIRLWHTNDTNFNNFPSLHVAFTTYGWLVVWHSNRRIAYYTAPIALCIVLSVLFVKTHLVIDLVGGLLLAWGASYYYRSRFAKEL